MTRRRLHVSGLLVLGVALAFGGFYAFTDLVRDLETMAVLALVGPMGERASAVNGHVFQVLPPAQEAFRAELSPYCSSLIACLALVAIALFVLHGSWRRRLFAVSMAVIVVICCNVLRISGSLWMGYEFGGRALVLFHDWAGTLFALAYTMGGFFLMLFLLLPRADAQIPRAARVSDVL